MADLWIKFWASEKGKKLFLEHPEYTRKRDFKSARTRSGQRWLRTAQFTVFYKEEWGKEDEGGQFYLEGEEGFSRPPPESWFN